MTHDAYKGYSVAKELLYDFIEFRFIAAWAMQNDFSTVAHRSLACCKETGAAEAEFGHEQVIGSERKQTFDVLD